MEWQPIETAPKDGETVDLWMVGPDGAGVRVPNATYLVGEAPSPYWHNWSYDLTEDEFDPFPEYAPTHWMRVNAPQS